MYRARFNQNAPDIYKLLTDKQKVHDNYPANTQSQAFKNELPNIKAETQMVFRDIEND